MTNLWSVDVNVDEVTNGTNSALQRRLVNCLGDVLDVTTGVLRRSLISSLGFGLLPAVLVAGSLPFGARVGSSRALGLGSGSCWRRRSSRSRSGGLSGSCNGSWLGRSGRCGGRYGRRWDCWSQAIAARNCSPCLGTRGLGLRSWRWGSLRFRGGTGGWRWFRILGLLRVSHVLGLDRLDHFWHNHIG